MLWSILVMISEPFHKSPILKNEMVFCKEEKNYTMILLQLNARGSIKRGGICRLGNSYNAIISFSSLKALLI